MTWQYDTVAEMDLCDRCAADGLRTGEIDAAGLEPREGETAPPQEDVICACCGDTIHEAPQPEPVVTLVNIDGEHVMETVGEQTEQISLEFDLDRVSDGAHAVPLDWANGAGIHADRDEDAIHVWISASDPRGGFTMTIRRLPDGRLMLYTPYAGMGAPHMKLVELMPGCYQLGEFSPS